MKPIVWIIPLLMLFGGVLTFFFLKLALPIRLAVLGSEIAGALLVGFILWRRQV